MKKIILFTDLDGTLLDEKTYSFEKALPALELVKQKKIPLIICSSKTRREIERYRDKLSNNHPFISENGGGIFIPKSYFALSMQNSSLSINETDSYYTIILGKKYSALKEALHSLQNEGFEIKGFGDMTAEEVSALTGLRRDEAILAKERDFDEPFVFRGQEESLPDLLESIRSRGLNYTQGRLFHILGNNDKGKAVEILTGLYEKAFKEIFTVAFGDNPNDFPMFDKVDYPVIVQHKNGTYDSRADSARLIKAEGIGPEGWNNAVMKLLNEEA